ncbi:hypothetical protein CWI38_0084p0060 [Hamiltosporidium tvaerminnensis]|uniref:GOLD domain-containing protein n=1 Tax=Hamiltosporidium tvaerminnensis TaxID=1176355 RepID=A0A4Q9M3R3_9MICR|nr:hypothetical protein CWI38_0084p0060 [Hamiltosporidium tvaerminnensis]
MKLFFLFFFEYCFCWRNYIIIDPKTTETFYEQVKSDDLQLTIDMSLISKGTLNYRVRRPNMVLADKDFKTATRGSAILKYSGAGPYAIDIFNPDDEPIYMVLGSYVDKEFEVDEDTAYIKSILEKLKSDLRNIYNQNMRIKEIKEENLRNLKKAKFKAYFLFVIALLYILVAYIKLRVVKSFFVLKKGVRP